MTEAQINLPGTGPLESCVVCGATRRLFGQRERYNGYVALESIKGFWEIVPGYFFCKGHRWVAQRL